VDLEEYRRSSHDTWQRMAVGWERELDWIWSASRPVGEGMVAMLEPQPGQTVLELAAGTGETGFAAAALIGDTGKLISSDFAFEMVEAARRRAAQLGLKNVEFRVMDAEHMDLDDDSVDGVLCRWGFMLMADPAAALRETRRVLRDGGRVAFSVWGEAERNQWAVIARKALDVHGHMPPPEPGAPGIFAMADPARIRTLVMEAGFSEPQIEEVTVTWRFEDFEAFWRFQTQLAGGVALTLSTLSSAEGAEVYATMEHEASAYRDAAGAYAFPGMVLNAVAS
jgi:ubiquinone/menaquinone biosynthesis C-methylase UbiE